jgi:hypothetical protein
MRGFAPKVAKYTIRSANGAEYESQGQVRSKAEHVAPGYQEHTVSRPEGPKLSRAITPLQGWKFFIVFPRGHALRFASRLPLAYIFRAVGALFDF